MILQVYEMNTKAVEELVDNLRCYMRKGAFGSFFCMDIFLYVYGFTFMLCIIGIIMWILDTLVLMDDLLWLNYDVDVYH